MRDRHLFPHAGRWVPVTLIALVVVSLLPSCEKAAPEEPDVLRPVRFQSLEMTGGARTRDIPGTVRAGSESTISFLVSGNVRELPVSVGDEIDEGDLIAQIDDGDYQLQLDQANADASRARAERRTAQAEYERIRNLYEAGTASRSQLDQARAASESSSSLTSASRQAVNLARRQVDYCTLTAPNSGIISQVPIEVGENVSAGQAIVILTSGAETRPEVELGMPSSLITQVSRGQEVLVSVTGVEGQLGATVSEVSNTADPATQTYSVKVVLDEPNAMLRPGMPGFVRFSFGSADEQRLLVPPHTVGEDRRGRFAYVVNPDPSDDNVGVIERREVATLEFVGELLEIESGLVAGDNLVTAGLSRLVDGQRVRFVNLASDSDDSDGSPVEEGDPLPGPADDQTDQAGPTGQTDEATSDSEENSADDETSEDNE